MVRSNTDDDAEIIEQLVSEFRTLQVRRTTIEQRQTQIVDQLAAAAREEEASAEPAPAAPATNNRGPRIRARRPNSDLAARYPPGCRVIILNVIRTPRGRTNDPHFNPARERHATVTHVTGQQVWFLTDNGTETWRKGHNLRYDD